MFIKKMLNCIGGFKSLNILEEYKTNPLMHQNSQQSEISQTLLNSYNELSLKLEKILSTVRSKEDFINKINPGDSQESIVQVIVEKFGILNGFYAIVNPQLNTLQFLNNSEITTTNDKVPYFEIPTHCETDGSLWPIEKSKLNAWLIDLMFHATKSRSELIPSHDYKASHWLQNLPPHQSVYSLPVVLDEQRSRQNQEIDYLFCDVGEVLFFVYGWRWLIKYSQLVGLTQKIDLENVGWQQAVASHENIWEQAYWNDFAEAPEKEWIQYMHRGFAQDNSIKLDNEERETLSKYWSSIANDLDILTSEHYFFYQVEWNKIGLSKDDEAVNPRISILKDYVRHLLLNLRVNGKPLPDRKLPLLDETIFENVDETKLKTVIVPYMNHLVDRILFEENLAEKEKLINILLTLEGKHELLFHCFLRKVIFESLTFDLLSLEKEKISVAQLLNILHKRSRFPIIPTFFQIYLSKNRTPPEFLVFPVGRSLTYPAEVFLPDPGAIREKPVITNDIAIAILMLKPIWAIDEWADYARDALSSVGSFLNYQKHSPEHQRLRFLRMLIQTASKFMVDVRYYGSNVDLNIRANTTNEQYYYQAHEMRKLIRFIKKDTPDFVLDEIRLYFTILFGSSKFVINSFLRKGGELSSDFTLGNSFKELFANAYSIASRIELISEIGSSGMLDKLTIDDFKKMIQTSLQGYKLQIKGNQSFDFNPNTEEILINHFHFFCAIICGLRNALQHRRSLSLIDIKVNNNLVSITNLRKVRLDMTKDEASNDDIHPGSTFQALEYYVSMYAKNVKPFFGVMENDTERYLTTIPIPN